MSAAKIQVGFDFSYKNRRAIQASNEAKYRQEPQEVFDEDQEDVHVQCIKPSCGADHIAKGFFAKNILKQKREAILHPNACHACRKEAKEFLSVDISQAGYLAYYGKPCDEKQYASWVKFMNGKKHDTQAWLDRGEKFSKLVELSVV